MYSNKLVCCLKANGKILREFKDTVYIPFGAEYSILLKNLNSVRVAVNVSIDGNDATENVELIINPNSELELTRFIKNGNQNEGNRFKFIERTANIENHRGVGIEDGLIRISFQFERKLDLSMISGKIGDIDHTYRPNQILYRKELTRGISPNTFGADSYSSSNIQCCAAPSQDGLLGSAQVMNQAHYQNDAGITVPGSISDQKFRTVSNFIKDPEVHVMVLKLLGETDQGTPIVQPVNVKSKPVCTSCGKTNKATAKFCSECGTSLQIV